MVLDIDGTLHVRERVALWRPQRRTGMRVDRLVAAVAGDDVAAIGVLTGGRGRAELVEAVARVVCEDLVDLVEHPDEVLAACARPRLRG